MNINAAPRSSCSLFGTDRSFPFRLKSGFTETRNSLLREVVASLPKSGLLFFLPVGSDLLALGRLSDLGCRAAGQNSVFRQLGRNIHSTSCYEGGRLRTHGALWVQLRSSNWITTYVALIADNTAVQTALPQTFLVNARLFKVEDVPARLPAPRVPDGSVGMEHERENDSVLLESITAAMAPFPPSKQHWFWDCAPCYTHWEVIAKTNFASMFRFSSFPPD